MALLIGVSNVCLERLESSIATLVRYSFTA